MMEFTEFRSVLKEYNIEIDESQYNKFVTYYEFLVSENEKYNLTAITNKNDVFIKHFLDSLICLKHLDFKGKFLDIGSGAGFPSIPLKIIVPDLEVVIVDSLQKRIKFLEMLCEKLELEDVELIHGRAEEVVEEKRESFDFVTARAVASAQVLSELCIPYIKKGGKFLIFKGMNGQEEIDTASNALKKLGCKLMSTEEYELPDDYGKRTFFVFEKVSKTPADYPRHFSKIKSEPL